MSEPMSDQRRAEIRERITSLGAFTTPRSGSVLAPSYEDMRTLAQLLGDDLPALLADVERYRAALAEIKRRAIHRGVISIAHTALYGTT